MLLVAIAFWVHFRWFFSVGIANRRLYQRRFFGIGNRSAELRSIDAVTLRIGQNFLAMNIGVIRIAWGHNLIQLNSAYYRESELREFVERLLAEGVNVHHKVKAWCGIASKDGQVTT
jgi:hypothetical protein